MANTPKTIKNTQASKSKLLDGQKFIFDEFEFFPKKMQLNYRGAPCQLEPKMLQLLFILIENRPQLVSKEDLMQALWPDSVVSDWSLARLVSDTRKLIEDDGQQQSIIKTVRGKGFLFAAPVDEIIHAYPAEPAAPEVQQPINEQPKDSIQETPTGRSHSKWIFLVLAISALFAFYFYATHDPAQAVHKQEGHYVEVMYEIQKNLRLTKSTYLAQKRRRNELKASLLKKSPEKTPLSSEKRIRMHYPNLTTEEKFVFDQIRAMTEGPMYQGNHAILRILDQHPEIYREIETFETLYNHLNLWVNKYQKVFLVQPDMCFVFVGEEDGVPFPSEIDGLVDDWLINRTKVN